MVSIKPGTGDFIDLTKYVKKQEIRREPEVIDFSKPSETLSDPVIKDDFFSSFSAIGNTNSAQENKDLIINELKLKLEDAEYKINSLIDRVSDLERKIR